MVLSNGTWQANQFFNLFVLTGLFAVLQRRKNRIESAGPNSNQGVVDEETDSRFQT